MSSILKALKKLEEEKTVQEDVAGVNISREILRQQPKNGKIVLWFWITATLALVVIVTLSVLLLRKPSLQSEVTPAPAPAPAAGTVPAPQGSSGAAAIPAPLPVPEKRLLQQSRPAEAPPLQRAADKSSPPELPASQAPLPEPPRAASAIKSLPARSPEPAERPITLSGIAWNKDSVDRLAIINGQPAAIGATVGGVVVEDIMPDRVRVNSAGRSFEILLGNPPKTN